MGKKNKDKDEAPNPNSVSNRDIIQRLNFLYQASVYLNSVGGSGPSTVGEPHVASDVKEEKGKRKKSRRNILSTTDLSKSYIKSMKIVGQKATVKMDPSVKRTLCKRCNIILIPGSTAIVRVKSLPSHGHAVTYTCLSCNTSRRIPAPPTLPRQLDLPLPEPSTSQHRSTRHPIPLAQISEAMDTDPHTFINSETLDSRQKANQRKKKKYPRPRFPPLFASDVGHVVFRGNERLEG